MTDMARYKCPLSLLLLFKNFRLLVELTLLSPLATSKRKLFLRMFGFEPYFKNIAKGKKIGGKK